MRKSLRLRKVLLIMVLPIVLGMFPDPVNALSYQENYISADVDIASNALFYTVKVEKRINLDIHDEPIEQALRKIAQSTGLRLVYRGDIMSDKKVTLTNESISVSDALTSVLEGTNLEPKYSSTGYLLIASMDEGSNSRYSQRIIQETIRGTVTDASSGESLPGVNILIEGTTVGTTSDVDGNYELSVPSLRCNLTILLHWLCHPGNRN
ncbi:MAG: carboxypeptidase-like regulatory domain-containing protein [Balneolales bacterium]